MLYLLDVDMRDEVSQKMKNEYLASVTQSDAKAFLRELVNLSDEPAAVRRFVEGKFARFLPWARLPTTEIGEIALDESSPSAGQIAVKLRNDPLLSLRNALRSIWTEPDSKTKQWQIFLLGAESTMAGEFVRVIPAPTAFQQVVVFLLGWAEKTSICQNPDGCPAPYFLATRRGQKFCGEECTKPASRNYKLRWWQRNGKAWREHRASSPKGR